MFRTLDCIVFTIAFTRKREIQSIFLLTIGERVQQSGGVIDCEIMTYCIAVRAYNLYVSFCFKFTISGSLGFRSRTFPVNIMHEYSVWKNECNLFPFYKLGLDGELKT